MVEVALFAPSRAKVKSKRATRCRNGTSKVAIDPMASGAASQAPTNTATTATAATAEKNTRTDREEKSKGRAAPAAARSALPLRDARVMAIRMRGMNETKT